MCLFYKKNYRKAVTYFEECLDQTNNTFVEEALYYRAVSQYYSGEKEAGLSSLKRIAEGTMFYSDKATAFLAGIEN
jgi:outer membrane protein assembly factor BamD (BamD/ComL family)